MFYIKDREVIDRVNKIGRFAITQIRQDREIESIYDRITKDNELFKHCENVAKLSTMVGIQYGFNLEELIAIYTGAILHDAGKVRLNQKILYKKGCLTRDEKAYTETHTTIGYKLLKNTSLSNVALEIIRSHHEKIDGSGYPCSLEKKEISIYTQIITVCDMYEAMTSDRCYRKALSVSKAVEILEADNGINKVVLSLLQEGIEEASVDTAQEILLA